MRHCGIITDIHTDGRSRSVSDHFLLSPRLTPLVDSCGIVKWGDTRSRHCLVWLRLKLGSLTVRKPRLKWVPRRPAWSKATSDQEKQYKYSLEQRLVQLQQQVDHLPGLGCQNIHCRDVEHSEFRDRDMLDILTAIIEAFNSSLTMYGGCWIRDNRPVGAGRSSHTGIIQCIGVSCGKIQAGYIVCMQRLGGRVKRNRKREQAEELLAAAMEGEVKFLKEMKTIRKCRHAGNCELPSTVGGA